MRLAPGRLDSTPGSARPGSVQALGGLEKLQRDYLVADYLRDSVKQNIVASVHIEALWDASDPVGETQWLETLDKSGGVAIRYIAAAPFGTPEAAGILERQAAFPRVVGIRDILSFHRHAGEILRRARRQGLRSGLAPGHRAVAGPRPRLRTDDVPYQIEAVIDVARSIPTLQLVVNHCASPIDRDEEGMKRWRDAVKRLGREPNIMLKISNAAGYDPEPTYESVAPWSCTASRASARNARSSPPTGPSPA